MNFIKNNIFFVIFCAVCLIAGAAILWFDIQTAKNASRYEQQFQQQKEKLSKLQSAEVRITDSSVKNSKQNRELTTDKLNVLLERLNSYRKLTVEPGMKGTRCKSLVTEHVKEMRRQLLAAEVSIARSEKVRHFTFKPIIDTARIPDANTEVPVIMKRLQLVSDLVSHIAAANLMQLQQFSVETPGPIKKTEDYSVQVFNISVVGNYSDAKELYSRLLADNSQYLYYIPYLNVSRVQSLDNIISRRPTVDVTKAENTGGPLRKPRDDRPAEEVEDQLPREISKKERRIRISDIVRVWMPVHYIQFHSQQNNNNEAG